MGLGPVKGPDTLNEMLNLDKAATEKIPFSISRKKKIKMVKQIMEMDKKAKKFKEGFKKKMKSNQFRDILKVLTDIDNSAFFNYQEDK